MSFCQFFEIWTEFFQTIWIFIFKNVLFVLVFSVWGINITQLLGKIFNIINQAGQIKDYTKESCSFWHLIHDFQGVYEYAFRVNSKFSEIHNTYEQICCWLVREHKLTNFCSTDWECDFVSVNKYFEYFTLWTWQLTNCKNWNLWDISSKIFHKEWIKKDRTYMDFPFALKELNEVLVEKFKQTKPGDRLKFWLWLVISRSKKESVQWI